jgi:probable F420-dependent oxidoreductase
VERRFRFGVTGGVTESPAQWRDFVKKAEDLGYATVVVADHLGPGTAPMPTMLDAALATRTLRVGTQVLANDFRNPVLLAREAATIDLLSGGRLELGVGAGYDFRGTPGRRMASDWEQIGVPFAPAGERVGRLAEAVSILKRYFAEPEPFDFRGTHYRMKGVMPQPRAVQQPRPPIMVGGVGRRILSLGAREADIIQFAARPRFGINPFSGAPGHGLSFQEQVELVRATAGERYPALELSVFARAPEVTDDVTGATRRLAEQMQAPPEDIRASPWALIGSVAAMIERLHQERARYDLSYYVVGAGAIDTFAPVVAALAGR